MLRHGLICCLLAVGAWGAFWEAASAEQAPAATAATPAPEGTVPASNEAEASIRAALLKRVSLDVSEAPLRDVLQDLAQRHNVPLWIDEATLTDEGITLDSAVTIKVADITLKSVLNLILDPLQSTFVVADEVLKVTTTTRAEEMLRARIYDVSRIIATDDFSEIVELISACVPPETWDVAGGPASIQVLAKQKSLAIRTTDEWHEVISTLLDDLQTALLTNGDQAPARRKPNPIREAERALREKVRDARCSIDVEQTPLDQVLQAQATAHGIPILMDQQTLVDEGVAYDTGVTLHVQKVHLTSALKLLLDPLQLTWIVEDEVLKITTAVKASETLVAQVYDVRDLLPEKEKLAWPPAHFKKGGGPGGGFGGGGGGFFDVGVNVLRQGFGAAPAQNTGAAGGGLGGGRQLAPDDPSDQLVDALTRTISPDSWNIVGGAGVIRPYQGLLVIRQTHAAHDEIADFLHRLREIAKQRKAQAAAKPVENDKQPYLVIYRLDTISELHTDNTSAKDLVKLIPESVAPDSWKGAGGTGAIHATGEAIVVMQTKAVHEEIVKLLHELLVK